ncbi:YibE/F family protein [Staphylococcus saccharolyticus]|uniref:YibE/F-like family protein n=1 Tax=Staphylococcus saccharolyticus TaxID=33028 RepID=A0A380HB91_9STAP|nr:YibE/F family protein [Staphylococcus saccharolyticus]MBL7564369.1 YibE/F family protein [Staphylococcus saccharolyticus]MBL7571367.1 YibE/F family protein [Staphylococcus saccharolyticus]QQB99197.1 YibE/F family protein [Staphylococcus saccharolyticus]QRJ66612.1 YibE/F family protein [Staphylococcus saccharolyticus]RTX92563.1 YibE/F family protein [Staphylococcus saccharolyticus]
MSVITILGLLLLILMMIFGGKKGLISFFTLFLNFIILIISILLIIFGTPIYLVTFFFCIVIAAINLFVLNSYNVKTQAAFIGTIVTTLILILLIFFSIKLGHLQGFATEQQDETYVYSMNIGIDMVQFMVFTIVLAVIAAVIDLAITISSPMYELNETNPNLNQHQLFQSGMRVGREILATSANTIYLAYFGGQLTLFFWFFKLHYSFGHIINSKIFTQEFVSILLGGIAVTISIPITAWITAFMIKRTNYKSSSTTQKH